MENILQESDGEWSPNSDVDVGNEIEYLRQFRSPSVESLPEQGNEKQNWSIHGTAELNHNGPSKWNGTEQQKLLSNSSATENNAVGLVEKDFQLMTVNPSEIPLTENKVWAITDVDKRDNSYAAEENAVVLVEKDFQQITVKHSAISSTENNVWDDTKIDKRVLRANAKKKRLTGGFNSMDRREIALLETTYNDSKPGIIFNGNMPIFCDPKYFQVRLRDREAFEAYKKEEQEKLEKEREKVKKKEEALKNMSSAERGMQNWITYKRKMDRKLRKLAKLKRKEEIAKNESDEPVNEDSKQLSEH